MSEGNRLVVASVEIAKDLPNWLTDRIIAQRLAEGMTSARTGEKQRVGNAEVVAYLYTESLVRPMGHLKTNIYVKLARAEMGMTPEELTEEEKQELDELKSQIYKARGGDIKSPFFDILKGDK